MAPAGVLLDGLLIVGGVIHLRPPVEADRQALLDLHAGLSLESAYRRFFSAARSNGPWYVDRLLHAAARGYSGPRAGALVAILASGRLVGVASYEQLQHPDGTSGDNDAEVAFTVADDEHHRGIATLLLRDLAAAARASGVRRFVADVLPSNEDMLEVFNHAGLSMQRRRAAGVIEVAIDLAGPAPEGT